MTVPVVSIVGKSDSGKTTFLEKLIRALTARGCASRTVKHHVHDFDIDVPGKDSWRHAHAGAVATMVSLARQVRAGREGRARVHARRARRIAAEAGCDILLTEGYKREATVRIEVSRAARAARSSSRPPTSSSRS